MLYKNQLKEKKVIKLGSLQCCFGSNLIPVITVEYCKDGEQEPKSITSDTSDPVKTIFEIFKKISGLKLVLVDYNIGMSEILMTVDGPQGQEFDLELDRDGDDDPFELILRSLFDKSNELLGIAETASLN